MRADRPAASPRPRASELCPGRVFVLEGLDGPVALAPGVEFFGFESTPESYFPRGVQAPIPLAAAFPRPAGPPGGSLARRGRRRQADPAGFGAVGGSSGFGC